MIALDWIFSFVKLWTADRVDRSNEGNAEGLDLVSIVVDEVSMSISQARGAAHRSEYASAIATFILSPTHGAYQNGFFVTRRAFQKITTISTKYQ